MFLLDLQCLKKADLCVVIDTSGSVCGNNRVTPSCNNWSLLLSFVNNVIDAFAIEEHQTRVGLVTFSSDAVLAFSMNQYYYVNNIKERVLSIPYTGGQTNTGKALHITRTQCFNRNNGERPDVPNITVVITDGFPTVIEYVTNVEATALKQVSTVFSVGITKFVDRQFLQMLSSAPQRENENYFLTPEFSGLQTILDSLVAETCHLSSTKKIPPDNQKETLSQTLNSDASVKTSNVQSETADSDALKGIIKFTSDEIFLRG